VESQPGDAVPGHRGDLERASVDSDAFTDGGDVAEPGDDVAGDGLVAAVRELNAGGFGEVLEAGAPVNAGRVA
jgi:hypothetical protein